MRIHLHWPQVDFVQALPWEFIARSTETRALDVFLRANCVQRTIPEPFVLEITPATCTSLGVRFGFRVAEKALELSFNALHGYVRCLDWPWMQVVTAESLAAQGTRPARVFHMYGTGKELALWFWNRQLCICQYADISTLDLCHEIRDLPV